MLGFCGHLNQAFWHTRMLTIEVILCVRIGQTGRQASLQQSFPINSTLTSKPPALYFVTKFLNLHVVEQSVKGCPATKPWLLLISVQPQVAKGTETAPITITTTATGNSRNINNHQSNKQPLPSRTSANHQV